LLVDNGSDDGTPTAVAEAFPDVEQLRLEENLGFGAGMNRGIRYALDAGAEYVFLVNNDTIIAADALEKLLAVCLPPVGVVAPIIYYFDEPDTIWSLGGNRHPLTYEMVDQNRGVRDAGQFTAPLERAYLVGCALLISRPLLLQVGGFDERFFMYYEDVDFSLRCRNAGWQLLVEPGAHLWHKVARSSGGSDSPSERYWMARSSVIFFARHVRGWRRWMIVIPYRAASALRTSWRLLRRGQTAAWLNYLRGLRDGFRDVANQLHLVDSPNLN
jgi:GT2 family glycosyltransferase